MKKLDLTGKTFGRLSVIKPSPQKIKTGRIYVTGWVCQCSCGNEITVRTQSLIQGQTRSCGCYHAERLVSCATKHGFAKHPINNGFYGMHARCYNPNNSAYKHYGARGIRVCPRWHTFTNFLADMREGWRPGLTIERLDVNGDYSPENCIWAARTRQARNKRNTVMVKWRGRRVGLADLCDKHGLRYGLVHKRIFNLGWSPSDAIKHAIRSKTLSSPPSEKRP